MTGAPDAAAAVAAAPARIRPARPDDLDDLLRLQAEYYREDGYEHHPQYAREAWQNLLASTQWGRVWVAETNTGVGGYLAMSLGYSLESLGRDATIDEFYLTPGLRGGGLGRAALDVADNACRELGVRTIYLEVEGDKPGVLELYGKQGYVRSERVLMAKQLEGGHGDRAAR